MSQNQQLHSSSMPLHWTAEQVLSLAPDENSRRVSRRMAGPEKWLALGSAPGIVWGEFPIKGKPSIETAVRLADPVFTCTCISKRAPCDHAISLLLVWAEAPDSFQSLAVPDWASARLGVIPPFGLNHQVSSDSTPLTSQPEDPRSRQAALLRGLEELELWLHDLARNGLAEAQQRPKAAWTQVAERLIDAGASEVAREVRQLAEIPGSGADWPERLLGRLGLLHLLIQGFKRLESLPPDTQADLRAAAGWLPRLDPARADLCLRDRWHVLSNQLVQDRRQRVQRTWLWGEEHNRAALIVQRAYNLAAFDTRLMTGTVLDADLRFFPSSTPLRANLEILHGRCQPADPVAGYPSIADAVTAYSRAISRNPWLGALPVVLRSAAAAPDGAGWVLRDESGMLPLPSKHSHIWQLCALTRSGGVPVFGEWDGETLQPLSVWAESRWVELRAWPGIK